MKAAITNVLAYTRYIQLNSLKKHLNGKKVHIVGIIGSIFVVQFAVRGREGVGVAGKGDV